MHAARWPLGASAGYLGIMMQQTTHCQGALLDDDHTPELRGRKVHAALGFGAQEPPRAAKRINSCLRSQVRLAFGPTPRKTVRCPLPSRVPSPQFGVSRPFLSLGQRPQDGKHTIPTSGPSMPAHTSARKRGESLRLNDNAPRKGHATPLETSALPSYPFLEWLHPLPAGASTAVAPAQPPWPSPCRESRDFRGSFEESPKHSWLALGDGGLAV